MQGAPKFQAPSPRLGRYPEHDMRLACWTMTMASRQQCGSQVRGFAARHGAGDTGRGDQFREALWFPGGVP